MNKVEFTKDLVYKAKQYILDEMDDITIDFKSGFSDFVTSVDKGVEQFLVNAINEKYDNQTFLTEEEMTKNQSSNQVWIIDPIDGTTNFIFSQKYFAISIAYYENGKPKFGIVYDVMADKMYLGIHGEGAYLNDVKLKTLDEERNIPNILFSSGFSVFDDFDFTPQELNKNIIAHRNLGSAAIEICHVADGSLHVYQARSLNLYDIAAAVIILEEVGGIWRFGEHVNQLKPIHASLIFYACSNDNIYKFLEEKRRIGA